MPTFNLKSQKLQCPFCSTVSTRGTGLSSHVRAQHPKEYGKWNKNPNRLLEAAAAASPQKEVRKKRSMPRVHEHMDVCLRDQILCRSDLLTLHPRSLMAANSPERIFLFS